MPQHGSNYALLQMKYARENNMKEFPLIDTVLPLIETFESANYYYIVTELIEDGNLLRFVKEQRPSHRNEVINRDIFR